MNFTPKDIDLCVAREKTARVAGGFSPEEVEVIYRYGAPVGSRIDCHAAAPRCMDLLRRHIDCCEQQKQSFASGFVICADELSGGRGRFSRSWHAPPGGLWLAVGLALPLLPEHRALLPLAAGVAVAEAIYDAGLAVRIKWVNDVHWQGRKMAGILAETLTGKGYCEEYTLLGIGVNVNNAVFPHELAGRAVSMSLAAGNSFDLDALGVCLLAKLRWNVGLLHYHEARLLAQGANLNTEACLPHPVMERWRALQDTLGRRVRFGFNVVAEPLYEARAVDLAADGGLILKLKDGRRISERAGEILYL